MNSRLIFVLLNVLIIFLLDVNGSPVPIQVQNSKFIISRTITYTTKQKTTTTTPKPDLMKEFDPQKYLLVNGYGLGKKELEKDLSKIFSSFTDMNKNDNIKKMTSLFQTLNNLPVTGELDNTTVTKMLSPRCGLPDLPSKILVTHPINPTNKSNFSSFYGTSFASYKTVSNWTRSNLRWSLIKWTPDLGERGTKDAIKAAFKYWSDAAPALTFTEVCAQCPADFRIDFGEHYHGDPYPFDGQGRTLAHAFFPQDGRLHFDESEDFTEGLNRGVNLRIVAAHEIGHALGLDHSSVEGALMAPFYKYTAEKQLLHEDDILGIQSLYGSKPAPTTLPPSTTSTSGKTGILADTTTLKTTTTSRMTTRTISKDPIQGPNSGFIPPCARLNEALFTASKNLIYAIINGEDLWSFNPKTRIWSQENLFTKFEYIESNVRGGSRCNKNYIWFFKGRKVWAYDQNIQNNQFKIVKGFPRYVYDPLYPYNPYTTVAKNGEFFLLKGNLAYKFDTTTLTIIDFPQIVTAVFPGAPFWLEATIKYDNQLFMFKGRNVYRFDERKNRVDDGYPQERHKVWSPCLNHKYYADLKSKETLTQPKSNKT